MFSPWAYLCTFLKILWAKQFWFFWGGAKLCPCVLSDIMSRLGHFTHMLQPWFCSGSCLMEMLVRMWVSHSLSLDSCLRPYHETGTCLVIAQWACGCFGSCLLLTQVQPIVLSKSSEFPVGITCMTQIFSCCVACVMVHLWTMCQHESLHIAHYSCVEKNTRYQWFIYWGNWCPFFKAVHKNA